MCTTWNVIPLQLLKHNIFLNILQFLKMQETIFKIPINLHEPQILKTMSLVCPDGGDLATPVPDSQGTSACSFAFYLKADNHGPFTQG